jgi:(4-(4-[2-(gamma-L-glutamylamino)ethyl]phenoxymethyl)furan-2-yl)methanamine synthase
MATLPRPCRAAPIVAAHEPARPPGREYRTPQPEGAALSTPGRPGGIFGWDIGGAHVKAAWWDDGALRDAAQWPCPLWQGLPHLLQALAQARQRWPQLDAAEHAVTMTGEMVDLFAHREAGVAELAALLARELPRPQFFAGDGGWCGAADAAPAWQQIASANWLATARHVALVLEADEGLLVDIGSTTTDLIAFRNGRVLATSRSDAARLASGELVYHGVVRTPLCALAHRIPWRGRALNVMNEFFATTADVYRLTGELDPAHDQQPSADGQPKDERHTQARLARLIGLDARDGSADEWRTFAGAWRAEQVAELRGQLARVAALHRIERGACAVGAGCGAFLVPELLPEGWRARDYASAVARSGAAGWAGVAAPAVAVAALYERERR